ncbi:MAG: type II toxin-antitoxin system RelE/ParE family toxin [Flavobacteriales bacterium]|nr:type II toxin-antitoxin system RelE/ParE family toxin [Flavobacteriales bacterium]
MKHRVIPTPAFEKELRPLLKRHRSLAKDLLALEKELEARPTTGTGIGHGLYKVRLAIASKGKGKSGGARVITYVVTEDREIYLLSIYDKGDYDTVDNKAMKALVAELRNQKRKG